MGFIDLKEVIDAFKGGALEKMLADYDLNGIALIRHELEGYADKHHTEEELQTLIQMIDRIIAQRREKSLIH